MSSLTTRAPGEGGDASAAGDEADATGPNPPEDTPRDESALTDHKTDDEVMAAFIATVPRGDDGAFAWGINKCASALGIGNKRAKRFLTTQRERLPEGLKAHAAPDGEATEDQLDHFDVAVAVGNGLQPAEAARPLLLPARTLATERLLDELLDPAAADGYAQVGIGLLVPAGARQP